MKDIRSSATNKVLLSDKIFTYITLTPEDIFARKEPENFSVVKFNEPLTLDYYDNL